jgi:hypothetical protein
MWRRLDEQLVDIAPAPILARLEALDDWMLRRVMVFGGVPVGRVIAASNMPAR